MPCSSSSRLLKVWKTYCDHSDHVVLNRGVFAQPSPEDKMLAGSVSAKTTVSFEFRQVYVPYRNVSYRVQSTYLLPDFHVGRKQRQRL